MALYPIACISLLSLYVTASLATSLNPAQCLKWGFSDPLCADCDSLETFVQNDEDLVDQCRQCCVGDQTLTYTQATLHVCPERIGLWPEVKSFIEKIKKADKLKALIKVKWVLNSIPLLKLKHEGGAETLRVDGWKGPQLEQFLQERVKPTSS